VDLAATAWPAAAAGLGDALTWRCPSLVAIMSSHNMFLLLVARKFDGYPSAWCGLVPYLHEVCNNLYSSLTGRALKLRMFRGVPVEILATGARYLEQLHFR
ncbi:hypothetical protein AMJ85_01405, partial [candidate division BRC1 bacterium SM23_51]